MEKVPDQVSRLSADGPNQHGCVLWTGATTQSGYGKLKIAWRQPDGATVSKIERAQRIVYMIKLQITVKAEFPVSTVMMDGSIQPLEVSHLCHTRLCVNPDHLSLEPRCINQEREHCRNQGVCAGQHDGHPDCLVF